MNKLQKTASKILEKTGYLFIGASKKVYQPKAHKAWVQAQGDKTLRLDYNLNENSVVFDVGGYEGQWASDIYAKYNPTIHIFEPVQSFAKMITQRFENNNKITVHDVGLGAKTATTHITLDNDASSTCLTGKTIETIVIVDIDQFITKHNIPTIDLIKINIEGGEYDLLNRIIETGLVSRITDIQVQFHNFVPDAHQKMKTLQNKLQKTHKQTYSYPFIWENWTLKD